MSTNYYIGMTGILDTKLTIKSTYTVDHGIRIETKTLATREIEYPKATIIKDTISEDDGVSIYTLELDGFDVSINMNASQLDETFMCKKSEFEKWKR